MEVKPEPLLEMTADERVFIRNHMKCCFLNDATKMLLDILLREFQEEVAEMVVDMCERRGIRAEFVADKIRALLPLAKKED